MCFYFCNRPGMSIRTRDFCCNVCRACSLHDCLERENVIRARFLSRQSNVILSVLLCLNCMQAYSPSKSGACLTCYVPEAHHPPQVRCHHQAIHVFISGEPHVVHHPPTFHADIGRLLPFQPALAAGANYRMSCMPLSLFVRASLASEQE